MSKITYSWLTSIFNQIPNSLKENKTFQLKLKSCDIQSIYRYELIILSKTEGIIKKPLVQFTNTRDCYNFLHFLNDFKIDLLKAYLKELKEYKKLYS